MDFDLGNKEITIRQRLHQALDPLVDELVEESQGALAGAFSKIASTGYIETVLDRQDKTAASMTVREELAFISPSLYLSIEMGNVLLITLLNHYASQDDHNQLVSDLAQGTLIASMALVEGHGNVEDNPITTSFATTDHHTSLSGTKHMVINASVAHLVAVVGTMNDSLAVALIPRDAEGFACGARTRTLGLTSVLFHDIHLHQVKVNADMVLGPFDPSPFLQQVRMWEDEILVGASLGIMRRAYEAARMHAKSHNCGGKPLVAYQEVGFKLAEMLTLVHTAQLLAYRATWMTLCGDREAGTLLHCAKTFCAEAAESVASGAVQVLGGNGYVSGNAAEQAYRDAKFIQLAGTSTERSRMKIGDNLLKSI